MIFLDQAKSEHEELVDTYVSDVNVGQTGTFGTATLPLWAHWCSCSIKLDVTSEGL